MATKKPFHRECFFVEGTQDLGLCVTALKAKPLKEKIAKERRVIPDPIDDSKFQE